ncbi:hypothetical protein QUF90_14520 [Desulfococcaceae bacterium HSG9]|nr:hypothetical protein [Desulfococcaceae bacterium HSG9]
MKAVLSAQKDIADAFEKGLEAVEALVVRQNTLILQLIERIEVLENRQSENSGKPPCGDGCKKPVARTGTCDKRAAAKVADNKVIRAAGQNRLKNLTKRLYTQFAIVNIAVLNFAILPQRIPSDVRFLIFQPLKSKRWSIRPKLKFALTADTVIKPLSRRYYPTDAIWSENQRVVGLFQLPASHSPGSKLPNHSGLKRSPCNPGDGDRIIAAVRRENPAF